MGRVSSRNRSLIPAALITPSGTSNKSALTTEALDKLVTPEGKDFLRDFDALFFIYAGERAPTNRGALYYQHCGQVSFWSKRWPYVLAAECGSRMKSISGCCKEVAEMLGLPDLAARTENPGSEGLGAWCLLSDPSSGGRPQHLSAWIGYEYLCEVWLFAAERLHTCAGRA